MIALRKTPGASSREYQDFARVVKHAVPTNSPSWPDSCHPRASVLIPSMMSGDLSGVWSAFRAAYRTTLTCEVALILNEG